MILIMFILSTSLQFPQMIKLDRGNKTGISVLFDYTKEEDAGNADWVIDDNYPDPYPPNPVSETDWTGAISSWGFELDTAGIDVKTLPPDSSIKYGTSSPLDLSRFDVYVVCEPQDTFSYSERQAIFNFVRDGGGLFIVADHNSSDRNNNGWDSPHIWNHFGADDSFGMHFEVTGEAYNNITGDFSTRPDPYDSILVNSFGTAETISFHAGTSIYLRNDLNPSVKGIILYFTGYAVVASARFGQGRVIGIGDSSPADDSTGNSGNSNLFDGWNESDDRVIFLNGTIWLSGKMVGIKENKVNEKVITLLCKKNLSIPVEKGGFVSVFDVSGRRLKCSYVNSIFKYTFPRSGIYFISLPSERTLYKIIVM